MVKAYWLIGKCIVQEEQNGKNRAEYGKQIIENTSKILTSEFGRGFSITNIRYFRQFYQLFPIHHLPSDESTISIRHLLSDELNTKIDNDIIQVIFTQLRWTHIRQIMRIKNKRKIKNFAKNADKE